MLKSSVRQVRQIKWSNIRFGEEIGIIEIKVCTLSGALGKDLMLTVLVLTPLLNDA